MDRATDFKPSVSSIKSTVSVYQLVATHQIRIGMLFRRVVHKEDDCVADKTNKDDDSLAYGSDPEGKGDIKVEWRTVRHHCEMNPCRLTSPVILYKHVDGTGTASPSKQRGI